MADRPVGVVTSAGSGSQITYRVHTDHLERPVLMTDGSAAVVWQANYLPYGEVVSITGTATLDQRFAGQWFQLESGLAYNWHRHYDATTGRYLQPDPLCMPDGPSRYAYVENSPLMGVDPTGEFTTTLLWWWRDKLPPPYSPWRRMRTTTDGNYCMAPEGDPPLISIPEPGSPEWCLWVKDERLRECREMSLPTRDFGITFQRCVDQCLFDNGCGGNNYPEGWLPQLWLAPKPWEGWK